VEPGAIDYSELLDRDTAIAVCGSGAQPMAQAYPDRNGVHLRAGPNVQDIVRLPSDALLLASRGSPALPVVADHWQKIDDHDWIHIQVRLDGPGVERVGGHSIRTPARSCIVTRYPAHSIIHRVTHDASRWMIACLWLKPGAAAALLDVSERDMPEGFDWLVREGTLDLKECLLPLHPNMASAVMDMTSCTFMGSARRAYMHAKSLELLSIVLGSLSTLARRGEADTVRLSARDRERIVEIEQLMKARLDTPLSLAALARRAGLNRTKLALGFKAIFGSSVHEYWRDLRLTHAKEILMNETAQVSEVAARVGYSEISSFTRAFYRKFGVLPRDCRASLR
jgi:AraC-like DNA-binding protein